MTEDIHEKLKKAKDEVAKLEAEALKQLQKEADALSEKAKAYGKRLVYRLEGMEGDVSSDDTPKRTRLKGEEKKARDDEMVQMFNDGKTHKEIEDHYGMSYQSVHKILKEGGITFT